ncbi:MAG: Ada regulatory protein/6-O-methylguanine-DNA methyltransferase [Paenibacillus sp.]|nr:Ada regulatory protein/6-O-methylguanine-DNA methyltransferase [Paenibacillus sp.]
MKLDRSLFLEPPTSNLTAHRHFQNFPVFLRQEQLYPHQRRLHVQSGIEINLALEGRGMFVVDGEVYVQSPGQLLLFSGQLPHQVFIDHDGAYKRLLVLIDNDSLQRDAHLLVPLIDFGWLTTVSCLHVRLTPDMYMAIKQLLLHMIEEMNEKRNGWQQMVVSHLLSFAVLVRRSMEDGWQSSSEPLRVDSLRKPFTSEQIVSVCCEYIDSNLHQSISLQSVAALFHFNPDYLSRLFKREKGLSFHQYVLLQRVRESKRLLRDYPLMPLTDIAYAVGFSSSSHFCQTFKNMNLLTPSEYRRQASDETVL